MLEINLFDSNFVGQHCSVALQTPTLMCYVRGQMRWSGITVFTDRWMFDPIVDDVFSRFKIGWLHEGWCLHPENYEDVWKVAHKFNAIMTHDAELLASGAPFVKTIRGGSWVMPSQWDMYPKSKNVSMILSEKRQTQGHKLRHVIAEAGLPIDCYGPEHTPIGYDKSIAYRDYRFAVVVEACREDNFFSEHLIDAIAYGCVPIYWGCPNIDQYFSMRGMWQFSHTEALIYLFKKQLIEHEDYHHLRGALAENQQIARVYAITEDWQVEHCLRPFVEVL